MTGWRSRPAHHLEVGVAELVPLGDDRQGVGPLQGAVGPVAVDELVAVDGPDVGHRLGVVDADARRRRRAARRSATRAGASRMSSVRGLNARPQTATRLALQRRRRSASRSCRTRTSFWASLTASTASIIRGGRPARCGHVDDRADVLGEADCRRSRRRGRGSWKPIRWSWPMPRRTSLMSAPYALAQVGHLVDEADLGRQHGVGDVLGHLGALGRHDQERPLGAQERGVQLAQHARRPRAGGRRRRRGRAS